MATSAFNLGGNDIKEMAFCSYEYPNQGVTVRVTVTNLKDVFTSSGWGGYYSTNNASGKYISVTVYGSGSIATTITAIKKCRVIVYQGAVSDSAQEPEIAMDLDAGKSVNCSRSYNGTFIIVK